MGVYAHSPALNHYCKGIINCTAWSPVSSWGGSFFDRRSIFKWVGTASRCKTRRSDDGEEGTSACTGVRERYSRAFLEAAMIGRDKNMLQNLGQDMPSQQLSDTLLAETLLENPPCFVCTRLCCPVSKKTFLQGEHLHFPFKGRGCVCFQA